MSFILYVKGEALDISLLVKRNSVRCTKALSMNLEQPFGESSLTLEMWDGFLGDPPTRIKPLAGQQIIWKSDDVDQEILFNGIVKKPRARFAGRNNTEKVLGYSIEAVGPEWLFEQKIISGNYKNFSPGTLIDQFASIIDNRLSIATNNDQGYAVDEIELARMTYKEAASEVAKSAGLMVWIDENWRVHHKKYATILGLPQESKFNILDQVTILEKAELEESIDDVCTRVNIIGSEMDAGDKNAQNRKQGKQKREPSIYTKTATLAQINVIRSRMGYSALVGVDPETLTIDTPGIIEKDINAQEIYDNELLETIAAVKLAMDADPKLTGTAIYKTKGLVQGKSLLINSALYQHAVYLPVIDLEISTAGAGNDTAGNRIYTFTANFNGPAQRNILKQKFKKPVHKKLKTEALIKPGELDVTGHVSEEHNATLNVTGAVIRSSA